MTEQSERAAVVAEARTWTRTPYHHMGRVKGGGVDCATLLCCVFEACGLVPHIDPGYYPPDWHLHRDVERYLDWVRRYAHRVDGPPNPGDIALWRFGRCFSHAAIILAWPLAIHAEREIGVCTVDAARDARLGDSRRPREFWSLWGAA